MAAAAATGPSVSTSPLNINDNKKRWVVFGLALKDLVDQIRPFGEKEIQTEYATVKASHGIDSQGASGRLTQWPTFLKYENINGNDAIPKVRGKYNYSAFDCRVTSHVDFAKLYLENYMAKFTMFDEQCDASSVLILLGKVPGFPVAVQNAANNVRQDRNAWAHCAFQDWDATRFRQSFQDMERLVNALGMPAGDKTVLLEDLKIWEKTGPSLCMNTSVDPALLQMVEQHVNKLIADVDNLIFDVECDKEKIKKTLQDVRVEVKELAKRLSVVEGKVEIVEQRVTQLENQRSFSLPQISIEIADCEAEISFFAARHDADTRQWLFEDFNKWFHSPGESRAYVLLGDAGVGKSVIAGALAQRARNGGHLGAAYFCRHNDGTRNDPRNLLGTIANQLCKCNVQYSNIVGGEGGVRMMLANSKLGVLELFTKLLQEPLGKCTPYQQRKLVIIDALDETEYKSRDDFLDLVMHRFPRLPKWLLFFITSRPENTVQSTLQSYHPCIKICAGSDKDLHVYQQHEQDIKRFLKKRVDFSRLSCTVEDIIKKCSGLFLYAFYMVDLLSDLVRSGNVARLNELFPGNIDDFFRENFKRIFDKVGKDFFRKLFGSVVVAPSSLPCSFIPFLLEREKLNLDEQEVIDTVSIFLVLRASDQTYTFLHNLIPSWLTDLNKAGRFYIDREEAGEYLKKTVLEFLSPSIINVAWKKNSSIETGLLDYFLRVGVRVLCRYEDTDSMMIVYNCLKSYQFIHKRMQNGRIEVYSVIGDLKLSARCQTLGDTEKEILQEICICLERSVHTLLECPHLLHSCLQKASKAVKLIMTIPDEVSTTWMEWRWLAYSIPKNSRTKRFFAFSPDKKLLAEVKQGRISLFNSCSLEKSLGPVNVKELEGSNHLAFSPCGDFVLFGKLNRAFSVKRGGVEDYCHSKEFSFLYEWCLFTLDQQHIVVKRESLPSPTCWSCLLNYLCLWARNEITQSQESKPLCCCIPDKLDFLRRRPQFRLHSAAMEPLIVLLRSMQCEEWCSLLEKVQPGYQPSNCERCKSSEEYEALTLKEVRQFIIDHYEEIFKYQVWDRRTSKPVLDEVFSSGAELDAFMYLCHNGTAFEVCGELFTGIERSLSLGNIALLVTVCHCIIFNCRAQYLSDNFEMLWSFHKLRSSTFTDNPHEAIEKVLALSALSTTMWLELQNFPDKDKKVFFSGYIPCLSPGAIWVARTRGTTVDLFRRRHSLQEQYSHMPEHVIRGVAQFGFTNDHSFFVYFSVHHSLHALSLQSGTILQSVSGVCPWVFDPEGQPGYLFHADDEDVTIFLKDFPLEFLNRLMSPVNTPMQINYVSDATLLGVCADSSVVSFQSTGNANSLISELSSNFGTLGSEQLKRCAFSPDGKLIAAQCGTKITLHDTSGSDGCRLLCTVCESEDEFTLVQLIFSADSSFLFYCILQGGSRPAAVLWDVREKVLSKRFDPPVLHPEKFCCCFTVDNKLVLCTEIYIEILDLAASPYRSLITLTIDVTYGEADKITYCTVSPINDLLACCILDRIVLYSLDNPTNHPVLRLPRAHLGKIEFCRFLKGNRYIISYGIDGAVFLWDLLEQTAVSFITILQMREEIISVTVSPEEDKVVGCTSFGRLFEIKLYGLKSEMLSLQFQPQRMMREYCASSLAQTVCPNAELIPEDTDILQLVEEMDYMCPSDLSEDSDGDETTDQWE